MFRAANRNLLLFLAMAAIWGSTWIPMKVCVGVVPPVLFAGLRFVPSGLLLLALWARQGGGAAIKAKDVPRLVVISLLMTTIAYALMFWAMQYVRTGMAAVIDFTVTPIFLLGFAVLAREETFHLRQALALGLGAAGLVFLFWSALTGPAGRPSGEFWGAVAVVLSVAAYSWGSVLARPLLRTTSSLAIGGITNLVGGIVLLVLSPALEPGALQALRPLDWSVQVWLGWAFLVVCGTVIAATVFLVLVREWGPSRAGAYAFVSPVIAVAEGVLIMGERIGAMEIAGSLLMFTATFLALRPVAPSVRRGDAGPQ